MHQVAAIATTLKLAASDDFKIYAKKVIANAAVLAETLIQNGANLVTGGTDNHMIVVNTMAWLGLGGHVAEKALDAAGITLNKQLIPDDPLPAMKPSGAANSNRRSRRALRNRRSPRRIQLPQSTSASIRKPR